jgi:ubiquinone/menaquinone biosynthesis C-methylase UbiE
MKKMYKLPFEDRYSYEYSKTYYQRHKKGGLKAVSNYLEQHMLKRALHLAGNPKVVLDIPCGAGRFFNTVIKAGATKIIAADNAEGMLQVVQEFTPADVLSRVELLLTNVADINLPDNAVDGVVCMRLLHHIDTPEYRNAIFRELHRVSRDTVCISFWVDGNYKSYRKELRAKKKQEMSGCLKRAVLEKELQDAGFTIVGHVDMLKYLLFWRTYVLKV